jgi:nicotinamide-nucleotide amidase
MAPSARDVQLAESVGRALGSRSLATAESCTAGLVAQSCAAVAGSMDWFRGGVVAYQASVKHAVLGVPPGPVVTPDSARQMALGVTALLSADVAVSVTGVAGPEPLDGVEPGVVIVGIAISGRAHAVVHVLGGSPSDICEQACTVALGDLLTAFDHGD